MHYSTNDLIHMITTNNLAGVYARLLQEGLVSGTMPPSVDAISYTVQEQARRLAPADFILWMERAFDVPVDISRPYATELKALAQQTGRTPARLLVEQFRDSLEAEGSALHATPGAAGIVPVGTAGLYRVPAWLSWAVVALAVVGLFMLVRALARSFADH